MGETTEETSLDICLLADIAKKILQNFMEMCKPNALSGKARYNHVDVTLSKKERNYYEIEVTNYGQSPNNILKLSNNIFRDLISARLVPENTILATIYSKVDVNDFDVIYDLRFVQKRLSLSNKRNDKQRINFSYCKEYFSFKLRYTLISTDLDKMQEIILHEIISLQTSNPHVKFTYHHNQEMLYNNHTLLDDDYKSCQAVSTTLTNIIKQSVNPEFKKNCLDMLNVYNTHQVKAALMIKLLPMIQDNYTFPSETDDSTETNDI